MDERRQHKRVPIDAILMCQIPEQENREVIGFHEISTPMSVDISLGGLQMKTDQDLPVGLSLSIFLSINTREKPVELTGKVAWCVKEENETHYKIGVEFTGLEDKRKKKIIQDYVDRNE